MTRNGRTATEGNSRSPPAAPPPSPHRADFPWHLVWLAAVMAVAALIRVRLLSLPLERDEGEYAYGGQLLLSGGWPYRDLYSMKWPGVYGSYALIFLLGGQSVAAIHLGLLAVNLCSAAGMYWLTRQWLTGTGAVWSACVFLALTLSLVVHGVIANAEHFALLWAVWGMGCVVRAEGARGGGWALLGGLLLGMAPVMKQHAVAFVAWGGLAAALAGGRGEAGTLRRGLAWSGAYIAGVGLVWGGMFAAVAAGGVWSEFVAWTVEYPRAYTSQVPLALAPRQFLAGFLPILSVQWPLYLWAAAGAVWLAAARPRGWLLRGWGISAAALAAIMPGFYFREHYFLFLAPAGGLLCGWSMDGVRTALGGATQRSGLSWARNAAAVFALALPALIESPRLLLADVESVSRAMYGNNPFVESPAIGRFLKERMPLQETVAIFGSEPQIPFYAQRRAATGFVYMYPLTELHPLARTMQQRMIEEITAKRPEYAVLIDLQYSWLPQPGSETLVVDWMFDYLKQYEPIGYVRTAAQPGNVRVREASADRPPPEGSALIIYRRRAGAG